MLIVALTGGIASGKSTVAHMLTQLGAYIIDYDLLSRAVVEPGKPAWKDIVDYFGEQVLLPDETLNRAMLGEIVFSDASKRKKLEEFVHPRISEEQDKMVKEIAQKDPSAIIVADVPLLFEVNLQGHFKKIILAYAPPEVQIERLMQRDGYSQEEARKRLDAQMSIEDKLPLVDYVVHNQSTREKTSRQVEEIFLKLRKLEQSMNE